MPRVSEIISAKSAAKVIDNSLTEDGKNWLTQSLDPFHDVDVPVTGYPDWSTTKTVVSCYKKQYTINQPAGMGGTGNWDCHITTLPLMASMGTIYGAVTTQCVSAADLLALGFGTAATTLPVWFGTGKQLSPLLAISVPSGSDTFPSVANDAPPANLTTIADSPPATWIMGNTRLVGLGFEVINSTADLYRGGTVTMYRCPQTLNFGVQQSYSAVASGTVFQTPAMFYRFKLPPSNVGDAILLDGTVSRPAESGAYVAATMCADENPLHAVTVACPAAIRTDNVMSVGPANACLVELPTSLATASGYATQFAVKPAPFDTCGAFFSGLDPHTSLTLNIRYYIEKAPAPTDTSFAPLARAAAQWDPVALQMYKHIVRELPPGCSQSDNPAGEWWRTVLSTLGDVLPAIGSVIPIPGVGLLGTALGGVAKSVSRIGESPAPVAQVAVERQREPAPRARTPRAAAPAPKSRRSSSVASTGSRRSASSMKRAAPVRRFRIKDQRDGSKKGGR